MTCRPCHTHPCPSRWPRSLRQADRIRSARHSRSRSRSRWASPRYPGRQNIRRPHPTDHVSRRTTTPHWQAWPPCWRGQAWIPPTSRPRSRADFGRDPAGGGVRRHGRHAISPADQGRVPHAHDARQARGEQPAQVFRRRRRRAPQPAREAQSRLSRARRSVRRCLCRLAESSNRHAGRHAGGVRIDARRVRSGPSAGGVRPSAQQRPGAGEAALLGSLSGEGVTRSSRIRKRASGDCSARSSRGRTKSSSSSSRPRSAAAEGAPSRHADAGPTAMIVFSSSRGRLWTNRVIRYRLSGSWRDAWIDS